MTLRPAFLILLLGISAITRGQQWDFISWHTLKAGGELTKKISLSVEQQLRINENSTNVDETFTELGLEYDLPKGMSLGGAYRFSWVFDEDGSFYNRHRYNLDLEYGRDIWKLKAKLRGRFQHRPANYLTNDRLEPDDSPIYVRLKLAIDYADLKKWKPGFAFEIFLRTDGPVYDSASKFRYRVSLDYDLPKRQTLSAFYMLETDHSEITPAFASIVGMSFAYDWKRPKKKKKKKKDKDE